MYEALSALVYEALSALLLAYAALSACITYNKASPSRSRSLALSLKSLSRVCGLELQVYEALSY